LDLLRARSSRYNVVLSRCSRRSALRQLFADRVLAGLQNRQETTHWVFGPGAIGQPLFSCICRRKYIQSLTLISRGEIHAMQSLRSRRSADPQRVAREAS
jgi:hypothetical protein